MQSEPDAITEAYGRMNYDQTHLRLSVHEPWPMPEKSPPMGRIGWLDQKGRIWTEIPDQTLSWGLGCGSFTPLLIQLDD